MTATNVEGLGEVWKDIPGYEGRYQASNLGRIKSLARVAVMGGHGQCFKEVKEKVLNPGIHKSSGYRFVGLNGRKTKTPVHRAIAKTFIPNPDNKPFINHIDGNKINNRVENLEWCTAKENVRHAIAMGLTNVSGVNQPTAQINDDIVRQMRAMYKETNMTYREIANHFGVIRQLAERVITGYTWKHVQ
ncbi:NUMOD4 domain-containing protein [Spirosoma foliorum]|uniref:HNH endonuclease n=1 Tax=Spirosoma foliorum TaxID=2710596 RepID=A0A7G5H2H8_9BACT|nr:NUMOD4 domain-containing protein [Spirosoma foliorum]QMW05320.1 HNH endonuclease [Spirosoma foliorum]